MIYDEPPRCEVCDEQDGEGYCTSLKKGRRMHENFVQAFSSAYSHPVITCVHEVEIAGENRMLCKRCEKKQRKKAADALLAELEKETA